MPVFQIHYQGNIMSKYRSNTCGELRKADVGRQVRLSGWIHSVRDHGGVIFIDLRDHYGITQVVITHDPEFALSCCTHVAVMDRGRITEAYPLEESGISRLASFFRSEYHAGEDDPSIRKTPYSGQKE